ncbi:MAG: hypothetical protein A3B23_03570 [Candidatus Colwellbacteria bacterium RIFCSPLOWO2_01_FULL_48_10]|uniref:Type II secretion system protein GspG C-terminal domain-containing protein n=1 Tax=Candidatus Colwellbacteria bacterium RIFCSPLOWO2_01_FULL_48_10 TaxID=1797690 RepID=A0A1G1Z563_9BACT|nr:MAG: hypothetical protein A3B23_03570 [Candidatus Colwellbacteria bacterium RIFCSPLOWO2_01_FULL_48_10]
MQKVSLKKGFTLVELLIVIGILAVLATTAVVILNPAQLLAQARDGQRLSDMASIQSAIALYMTDYSAPKVGPSLTECPNGGGAAGAGYRQKAVTVDSFLHRPTTEVAVDTDRNVDGTGWIPVDFTDISGGTPLSILPIDPSNDTANDYVYRYACNYTNNTFELNAKLESLKYDDYMANTADGGDASGFYEIGTSLNL